MYIYVSPTRTCPLHISGTFSNLFSGLFVMKLVSRWRFLHILSVIFSGRADNDTGRLTLPMCTVCNWCMCKVMGHFIRLCKIHLTEQTADSMCSYSCWLSEHTGESNLQAPHFIFLWQWQTVSGTRHNIWWGLIWIHSAGSASAGGGIQNVLCALWQ